MVRSDSHTHQITPVILAGGKGSRLAPISSPQKPKQFLPLIDVSMSLLQQTLVRANVISNKREAIIMTHQRYKELAFTQTQDIDLSAKLVLEPYANSTAPAMLVLAAFHEAQGSGDEILLFMPADHYLPDTDYLHSAILDAAELASDGSICVFGMKPTHPSTQYGYIMPGEPLKSGYNVSRFVEKPEDKEALYFTEMKEALWNSGMFLTRADTLLEEAEQHCPGLVNHARLVVERSRTSGNVTLLNEESYVRMQNISIDYAVMQKTQKAAVIPLHTTWSDIGSWDALINIRPEWKTLRTKESIS